MEASGALEDVAEADFILPVIATHHRMERVELSIYLFILFMQITYGKLAVGVMWPITSGTANDLAWDCSAMDAKQQTMDLDLLTKQE